jgi:hypothetical protein
LGVDAHSAGRYVSPARDNTRRGARRHDCDRTQSVELSTLRVSDSYLSGFLPGILCVATGFGLAFVPLTMTATSAAKADDQGLASGIFNTSQQVGGAVGLAVLAAIASTVTANAHASSHAQAFVSGYTTAFALAAAITLTAVAVVVALLPA